MKPELKDLLENRGIALVSMNENGSPHLIAVAYAKVVENKIIITDNFMKTTSENIKRNPKVLLAVWNENFEGYRIEGSAEYHDKGSWLKFVKGLKKNECSPAKGAIVVTISETVKLG